MNTLSLSCRVNNSLARICLFCLTPISPMQCRIRLHNSVSIRRVVPVPRHVVRAETQTAASVTERDKMQEAYRALGIYLKTLGIDSPAEVARVADICMNPNSMFEVYRDRKRNGNKSARRLDVAADVKPVIDFLKAEGATDAQIRQLILSHPPVLCYSVETRLKPFFDQLREIGSASAISTVMARPSILGLDPEEGLRRIIGWLKENNYTPEQIIEYIGTSL